MQLRVRWPVAGKALVICLLGLVALKVLTELLQPPPPAPLPPDVGLPQAVSVEPVLPKPKLGRVASGGGLRSPKSAEGKASSRQARDPFPRSRAKGKEGAARRQDPPATRSANRHDPSATRSADRQPPATRPVPPPAESTPPEPPPSPAPEVPPPPPPPPDDGSMEFAPH